MSTGAEGRVYSDLAASLRTEDIEALLPGHRIALAQMTDNTQRQERLVTALENELARRAHA